MTLIQPNKHSKSFFAGMILLLLIPLVLGVVWLVILYNKTVDARHTAAELNAKAQALQAQNAQLQNATFALFTTGALDQFAAAHDLVIDKSPQYVPAARPVAVARSQQWAFASHF